MRESDAQEAVRFGVARRKRFQRLGPLQQISRLFEYLGAQRVQTRRLYRAVEQLGTQCSLQPLHLPGNRDRKSTRLNSSHGYISYAVFCLKKKKKNDT